MRHKKLQKNTLSRIISIIPSKNTILLNNSSCDSNFSFHNDFGNNDFVTENYLLQTKKEKNYYIMFEKLIPQKLLNSLESILNLRY